ncbi:MAG: hypothetical protein IT492_22555 [Gammaproteobacteria bacterium]|nr:hypothetical protein [Gammaproteobacteria bacterium]
MSKAHPAMLLDGENDDATLREVIFDTIENQIRDGQPPATAATLQRLMDDGMSRELALRYIGCVLSVELFEIVKHSKPFDNARYVSNLEALPELPYDEDEI